MTPHIAKIDPISIANGPGVRVAVFVSGCRNACPYCFNPEAQRFDYGKPHDTAQHDFIVRELASPHVSGLTLLGGEPLEPENQQLTLDICRAARDVFQDAKTIWVYTGFTFEALTQDTSCRANTPLIPEILDTIDVLVDGPFVQDLHDISLRFRGSSNQRLIDIPKTLANDVHAPIIWDDGEHRGVLR